MVDGEGASFDTRLDRATMDEIRPDEARKLKQWYADTHA